MNDAILRTRGLTRRYGDMTALDNVDLDVQQGEFIALLGPSGCGKTTLLRCIGGFIEPTSGDVFIGNQSMRGVSAHQRPINTVFQNYALFPHMSVSENVAYGPRRAGASRIEIPRQVHEALEMVGLPNMGDRFPSQLSGGQQQRVALARAIINRPRVLLLDEPLGALDLKLRKHMQIELKRLQEQLGITFIFVTHDQEEALVMADRIAVMNAGRIEQIGQGKEIYQTPNSLFVADFIGDANFIDITVDRDGYVQLADNDMTAGRLPESNGTGTYRMLVRPEKLHLGQHNPNDVGLELPLTVTRSIFIGDAIRVYGTLPAGQEISIKLTDTAEQRVPDNGTQITLRCAASSVRLYPSDTRSHARS